MTKSKNMDNRGHTLIELLIALSIASVMSAIIYMMFESQVRTQLTQLAIAELHQQGRAAMMLLEDEIRIAGADPTGYSKAGFVVINPNEIHFTRDITGGLGIDGSGDNIDNDRDGQIDENDEWYNGDIDLPIPPYDPQEDIRYFLTAGAGPRPLMRQTAFSSATPSTPQRVADNVQVIDFEYIDSDGAVTADPNKVHAVQVTLIVCSDSPVLMRKHRDLTNYQNLQGDVILPAPNDFRRRLILSSEVRVRNIGLAT